MESQKSSVAPHPSPLRKNSRSAATGSPKVAVPETGIVSKKDLEKMEPAVGLVMLMVGAVAAPATAGSATARATSSARTGRFISWYLLRVGVPWWRHL